MKDLVVCVTEDGFKDYEHPIKGEICTVLNTKTHNGRLFYKLEGYNAVDSNGLVWGYAAVNFRPVDLSYGPAICETIEQQIELEKVLI